MTIRWRKQVVYDKEAIRFCDPIPELLLQIHKLLPNNTIVSDINTIVTELYNNSVDHGLLDLSSDIKQQDNGLVKFYNLRQEKLKQLGAGLVVINFSFNPNSNILTIEASDTGTGFDFERYINKPINMEAYSGRGLYLINQLSERFNYSPETNTLVIDYKCIRKELYKAKQAV